MWQGAPVEIIEISIGMGAISITLDVTPSLYAEVSGSLSATGSMSVTSSAEGSLEVGADWTAEGFTLYQEQTLTYNPLDYTTTSFDVSAASASFIVTPVRYFLLTRNKPL